MFLRVGSRFVGILQGPPYMHEHVHKCESLQSFYAISLINS